jgi:hypothetical protein
VSSSLGECTFEDDTSSKDLTIVFDNTTSSVPVTFSVPDAYEKGSSTQGITRTVPAGDSVSVVATVTDAGATFAVDFSGVYMVTIPSTSIVIDAFPGCIPKVPGDPSSTNETCLALDEKVLGSITVGFETGLVYSITGPGTDISPVTEATTTGLAAGEYIVSVVAEPGYVLEGASSWPLTITIEPTECLQLPTEALVTPTARSVNIGCTAAGSYTLDAVEGVIWSLGETDIPAGTYPVTSAQTVEVSARPDAPDFGFGEDVSNPELFTFVFTTPDAAGCAQLTTLALTGGGSTNGLLFAGALSLFAVGGMLSIRRRAARS